MNTQVQKNIQRVLVTATSLVLIGAALNVYVMKTLGSLDAGSVILALYVASWAFVLGDLGLVLSALWFFMKRRVGLAEQGRMQPEASGHALVRVESAPFSRPCHGC